MAATDPEWISPESRTLSCLSNNDNDYQVAFCQMDYQLIIQIVWKFFELKFGL